eukprot:TRINITY_DN20732_c0_g1_i1.p1 TRINITY_DN20732_c0_g1~~TRINITY_DN20732_c0_g1_i1.p1  ORF type:complete len:528 (-),score=39.95 TRINITY_DN20732_c0_g1_i1:151-1734(-)
MFKKRKITVDVQDIQESDVGGKITWREGGQHFADWRLRCPDDKVYHVHRLVFAQGARASVLLARAFMSKGFVSEESCTTDLSELLPACCFGQVIEAAFDFAYTGSAPELLPNQLVLLCKVADVLQMPALLRECADALNKASAFSKESAPGILKALLDAGGLGNAIEQQIHDEAVTVVAKNFSDYCTEEILAWPVAMLEPILGHPSLFVQHEDDVFDLVRRVVALAPEDHSRKCLFQKVRFGQLSSETLARAVHIADVPKEMFAYVAIGKMHMPVLPNEPLGYDLRIPNLGLPSGWAGSHHFSSRNRARSFRCAILQTVCDRPFFNNANNRVFQLISNIAKPRGYNCDLLCLNKEHDVMRLTSQAYHVAILVDHFHLDWHATAKAKLAEFTNQKRWLIILTEEWTDVGEPFEALIPITAVRFEDVASEIAPAADSSGHPIFKRIDRNGCRMLQTLQFEDEVCQSTLSNGALMLASKSNGEPGIVIDASKHVICFCLGEHLSSTTTSPEDHQLLLNTLDFCCWPKASVD